MKTPIDALDYALLMAGALDGHREPGGLVSRLDADTRAALANLTSEQTRTMRPVFLGIGLTRRRRGRFNRK